MHPLEKMIGEGEHVRQDFKYFLGDARKIARSLAAFANTEGGRLLVGVKDNGKIVGLKHREEEACVVEAAAHVFCRPAVQYTTRHWEHEGKVVMEIQVAKSTKAPHSARPLHFTLDNNLRRLLQVLGTQTEYKDFDIAELSRLSLMTRRECIVALAGLIASGTIQTSR